MESNTLRRLDVQQITHKIYFNFYVIMFRYTLFLVKKDLIQFSIF